MVEYVEGNVNLSDREGREKAIEFAKSMNNYEKRIDLKDYIVDDLFRILRSNINLKNMQGLVIEGLIRALITEYEKLEFSPRSGMPYFKDDINADLGYIYSFYPHNL